MIAGLLLAAGRSSRFGGDKLTAKLDGKAVIRRSVAALVPTDLVYVVIAPGADMVTQALSRLDVHFVVNLARDEGMASSIRAGVAALPMDIDAVVIALGDQPLALPSVTKEICERWRLGNVAAVVVEYRDGRGHPVLFGRECFDALLALHGDVGARSVINALGGRVAHVSVDAPMPADVDTVDALMALQGTTLHK
ncbi:MAG: nucleotidyltransferase family protein [bacterium]